MCIFIKGGHVYTVLMYFVLKGVQVYPVPPSRNLRRPCCCLNSPLMVFVGDWYIVFWEMRCQGD